MNQKQSSKMDAGNLPVWKRWVLAARPKTLPAAAAPVITGSALALWQGEFSILPALAALIGAFWLQIGANLANDLFDYQRGVDSGRRLGPKRATQEGWLSPRTVAAGTFASFLFASICGVYLVNVSSPVIIVIGLTAILSAVIYSGGPFPIGYHSLGDVFVFLYFGVIGVAGTYFVQVNSMSWLVIISSIPVGLLIVNILVVNNYRDLESDRETGKFTLAVRLGPKFTRRQFTLNLLLAYAVTILALVLEPDLIGSLAVLFSVPYGINLQKDINEKRGAELNLTLAKAGQFAFGFSALYFFGLVIGKLLL
jgi:1,4-dihydroxy-2-naphthoate octaprenyltransferase